MQDFVAKAMATGEDADPLHLKPSPNSPLSHSVVSMSPGSTGDQRFPIYTPHNHRRVFQTSSSQFSSHPQPESTTTMQTPHPHPPTKEQQELIDLSRHIIKLLNARAYDDPWFHTHVSPDVWVDFNGYISEGFKAFIGNYRLDADRSPDFVCQEETITAILDDKHGTAQVILTQLLRHFEDVLMVGKKRAATVLWSWRQKGGAWELQSVCMMFGTPQFVQG